jgi:hypothetical protein
MSHIEESIKLPDQELLKRKFEEGNKILEIMEHFAPLFVNKKSVIHILPCDDPEKGCIGFNVFAHVEENGEMVEHSGIMSFKVNNEVQKVKLSSKEQFEEFYKTAKDNDHLIQDCNDPITRTCGFIVHKGSGSFYYYLPLANMVTSN